MGRSTSLSESSWKEKDIGRLSLRVRDGWSPSWNASNHVMGQCSYLLPPTVQLLSRLLLFNGTLSSSKKKLINSLIPWLSAETNRCHLLDGYRDAHMELRTGWLWDRLWYRSEWERALTRASTRLTFPRQGAKNPGSSLWSRSCDYAKLAVTGWPVLTSHSSIIGFRSRGDHVYTRDCRCRTDITRSFKNEPSSRTCLIVIPSAVYAKACSNRFNASQISFLADLSHCRPTCTMTQIFHIGWLSIMSFGLRPAIKSGTTTADELGKVCYHRSEQYQWII